MARQRPWLWVLLPSCFTVTACNALWDVDELSFSAPDVGGQSPGGSGGQGGGGAEGAGGGAGGGVAGGTGVDCGGTFGPPEAALTVTDMVLRSPAVAVNQLELYYLHAPITGEPTVYRASRDERVPFTPGVPVPELTALCTGDNYVQGIDVSADGLRAYVGCGSYPGERTLVLAERVSGGDAPFVEVGLVGTNGLHPGLSASELTVFTNLPLSDDAPPQMAEREGLGDSFGATVTVPGLANLFLRMPGPTPDGLALFGHLDGKYELGYVSRPNAAAPFGAFTPVVTTIDLSNAPDVSADCRAVYFVGEGSENSIMEPSVIYVMVR